MDILGNMGVYWRNRKLTWNLTSYAQTSEFVEFSLYD